MATPIAPARAPYAPPAKITVRPPTFIIDGEREAGRELVIVLDVETGELSAERWTGRQSRDQHDTRPTSYYPGRDLYFPGAGHDWWTRDARRLGWSPSHYPDFPADRATFREHLDLMARWAKELVDALEPLPDGGYDWTLKATAAYERIEYLTSYGKRGLLREKTDPADPWHGDGTAPLPDRHHYGAVDFDEIISADPSWADPRWAAMTDAQLDEVADGIIDPYGKADRAKFLHGDAERVLKASIQFSKPFHEDRTLAETNQGVPLHPVGIRAGLRRWRASMAELRTGMPAVDAAQHLAGKLPDALVATTGDAELGELARLVVIEAAHTDKVALVGALDYLARARADMRTRARFELATIVAERAAIAAHLAQLTARRASLLAAVASFREAPEWPDDDAVEPNYAELGRLGGMTRQAALEQLRPLFAGDDADAEAERRAEARRIVLRTVRDADYGKAYSSSIETAVAKAGLQLRRPILTALLAELVDQRVLAVTESGSGLARYSVGPAGADEAAKA